MSQTKQMATAKQSNKVEIGQPSRMQQAPKMLAMWDQPQIVRQQFANDPHRMNAAKIAFLQRTVGNQALGRTKVGSISAPSSSGASDKTQYAIPRQIEPLPIHESVQQQNIETKGESTFNLRSQSQGELYFSRSGQIQRDTWYEEAGDWALGAIGGEWIDEPTFGQIGTDFVLSIIPYVDQVADARDLSAQIYRLGFKGEHNNWQRWLSLVFTLIGLFPEVGSVIKSLSKAAMRGLNVVLRHIGDILRVMRRLLPGDVTDINRLQRYIRTNWSRIANFGMQVWTILLSRGQTLMSRLPSIFRPIRQHILAKLRMLRRLSPRWLTRAFERARAAVDDVLEKVRRRLEPDNEVGARTVRETSRRSVPRFRTRRRVRGNRIYESTSGELGVPGQIATTRSRSSQRTISRGTGDDAGHRIGTQFGGPPGRENLARQNWRANRGGGTFYALENRWKAKLQSGTRITATVTDVTRRGDTRPFMRRVEWKEISPDGRVSHHSLDFANTHTPKSRHALGIGSQARSQPASVTDINEWRRRNHR